jgi:TRAP-type C4-dicarboxylate transport system permease small subunit
MRLINGFDRAFTYAVGTVCVVLFVIMIVSVFGQVIMRYVFASPLSWSEELARYAMVWQAMLASALCMQRGLHLSLLQVDVLPGRLQTVARYAGTVTAAVLLAFLFWHALDLASRSARQTTPGLGLSMRWIYASLPTGFGLMLVGLGLSLLANRLDRDVPGPDHVEPVSDQQS